MLKIVICEDNQQYLNILGRTIETVLEKRSIKGEIVCMCTDAEEAEKHMNCNGANVFFIDIDLKDGQNGYELAKKIRKSNIQAYIIFITGHLEYVFQAFKVQCFDFLPKPVMPEVIEECLVRVHQNYLRTSSEQADNSKYINIRIGSSIHNVKAGSIIYIERIKPKTIIYTTNSEISCNYSLEMLEEMLGSREFIRTHKSYIANKNFISEVSLREKKIIFNTGQSCFVGRKYKHLIDGL